MYSKMDGCVICQHGLTYFYSFCLPFVLTQTSENDGKEESTSTATQAVGE